MPNHNALLWINSAGGPLLLLEENSINDWAGVFNPLTGEAEPERDDTDYARAGQVEGYLGQIPVRATTALVLWGEPAATTWIPASEGGGMFVRWMAAESERELLDWLPRIPDTAFRSDGQFTVHEGRLILFDSALAGRKVKARPTEYLSIDLNPGTYQISTASYERDDPAWVVVHRLVRK
jgi:hypothetical protein